jgi:hypothetical protein
MSVRQYIGESTCFHCGKPVEGSHVTWEGYVGDCISKVWLDEVISIHLHTACADFMATGMKRDVLELQVSESAAEWCYRNCGHQRPIPESKN